MNKTFNYDNCTVSVHIPETKNNERIRKATENFLRKVIEEREARENERKIISTPE